jgi:hypothetical protein
MIGRREFFLGLGAMLGASLTARAQKAIPVIGYLGATSPGASASLSPHSTRD